MVLKEPFQLLSPFQVLAFGLPYQIVPHIHKGRHFCTHLEIVNICQHHQTLVKLVPRLAYRPTLQPSLLAFLRELSDVRHYKRVVQICQETCWPAESLEDKATSVFEQLKWIYSDFFWVN